ncbi:MAG: hypothetical protein Q8K64_08250 [Sediminibacterium sp.]|nr:hypothetical protein [Sediminibacterium sp.]
MAAAAGASGSSLLGGLGLLGGIGTGITALGAIGKFWTGINQKKLANQINPVFDNSNLAKNQSLANNMFNGRMAGAGAMDQNIINSGANFMSNVDRNAGSSASALALAAASQGQTNQALADLAVKEAQNKQQNAGLVMGANKDMNQSLMDKFSIDVQAKNALRNAAMMNKQGAVNDLGSMGMLMGQLQTKKSLPTPESLGISNDQFNIIANLFKKGVNW